MLIKIKDNVVLEEHLEDLKNATCTGSASKAVAIAATNFIGHLETIAEQSRKIDKLECKLNGILSLLCEKQQINDHINSWISSEID
jgi:hypothetical protein